MSKTILGLDVSTKTIGVCVLYIDDNNNKEIKTLTHITPKVKSSIKGAESLFLKKRIFETEFFNTIQNLSDVTEIVIEEPLLGSNNIYTVASLLRFNGMISDCLYEKLNIVPKYISSYDARKYAFPELMTIRKFNKKEESYPLKVIKKSIQDDKLVLFGSYPWSIDKKQIIWNKINKEYSGIEWIYDKNGNLKKENFDATDSLCAILGLINKEQASEKDFKIVNSEETNTHIIYSVYTNFGNYTAKIEK